MIVIYAFVSIVELLLYYFSALFISIKLLNSHFSTKRIVLSSTVIILLLISECFWNQDHQVIFNTIFPIIEIITLKLFSISFDLKNTISIYILLYFTNSIISACIKTLINCGFSESLIIELIVCFVYFILISFLCFSKMNTKLSILIYTTPFFVKIVLNFLLFFCYILIMLIGYQSVFVDYIWSLLIRITILIFVLVLSVSVPLLALYSSSSKYHKRLNDDYQKQIKAEAEYYSELAEANFELRRFKHNYNNTSIGFKRLLAEGKAKEALELLESQNQEMESSAVLFDTGSGIVDALLNA